MRGRIEEISYKEAVDFVLPRHYSGRVPTISKAFGWRDECGNLQAVCTFGKPASPFLCRGVCGARYAPNVYELNRLCRTEDWKEPLSEFVSYCLRQLKKLDWIVVSFSDMGMNHHGYIYQACNFMYTGCSKPRTDKYVPNGGHARHYKESDQGKYRKYRTAKHRYIYFCTKDRRLQREWMNVLNYPVMPYPKGDNNADYKLGDFMKEKIVVVDGGK